MKFIQQQSDSQERDQGRSKVKVKRNKWPRKFNQQGDTLSNTGLTRLGGPNSRECLESQIWSIVKIELSYIIK